MVHRMITFSYDQYLCSNERLARTLVQKEKVWENLYLADLIVFLIRGLIHAYTKDLAIELGNVYAESTITWRALYDSEFFCDWSTERFILMIVHSEYEWIRWPAIFRQYLHLNYVAHFGFHFVYCVLVDVFRCFYFCFGKLSLSICCNTWRWYWYESNSVSDRIITKLFLSWSSGTMPSSFSTRIWNTADASVAPVIVAKKMDIWNSSTDRVTRAPFFNFCLIGLNLYGKKKWKQKV